MDIVGVFIRACKRTLVLLLGAFAVLFAYKALLPYFHHHLPLLLALGLTYGAMAYIILPLIFRAWRLFFPSNHIPLHTVTPDGFACDPVNIGLVGSRRQIIAIFQKAGWSTADPVNLQTTLRIIQSVLLHKPYPTAPFSPLYLFGRKQDIGLQKAVGGSARRRHHVRFWQVIQPTGDRFRDHVRYWIKHYGQVQPGQTLWIGAATEDVGITILRHNAQVSHSIHADTNAERDFIASELHATGLVTSGRTLSASQPYKLRNRAGINLTADGTIKILEL